MRNRIFCKEGLVWLWKILFFGFLSNLRILPFAKFNINIYELLIIYVMSILSALSYLFNARIYKHGNISVSTPVLSSLPQLFIVLLAFIFLREKLTILQYLAIAVLLVATYFLIAPKSAKKYKQFDSKKYVYLLVLNTLIMAAGAILMKYPSNSSFASGISKDLDTLCKNSEFFILPVYIFVSYLSITAATFLYGSLHFFDRYL